MKKTNLFIMSAVLTLAACNGGTQPAGETNEDIIGRTTELNISNKRMTPEALWAMGRIGGMAVSPDGTKVAYTVSYYSVPQNKSNTEVFVMNADGSDNQQITHTPKGESNVVWTKDGKLRFLSSESGSSQIWEMNADGSGRKQLTNYDGDIEGFAFSPDENKVLFVSQIKTVASTADKYPDLPKATGRIITDLMYKHWDEWVTTAPHPFVADFNNGLENITDILEGEPYESPMKPFGGMEQLAWSPDGKQIAYTCRKKTGLEYAISTNSDIFIYDIATKQTKNICEEIKGYDTNPQYSPDGQYIAWQSMERDGYESDQNRLFIMNLQTGEKRFVSKAFESNVDEFIWDNNSKGFYFTGVWHGQTHIYNIDIANGDKLTKLTEGDYDFGTLALCGDKLLTKRHSMMMGDEIYQLDKVRSGEAFAEVKQMTFENKAIYDQLEMGKVEGRWVKTTDNKEMLVWVIYPPQFDSNKKYPTLLFCEGGPQSPVSQFWSYRWNFQMMAANDYIIVAPNRRGLPGFGNEWNEAISGDYMGQCMKDYLTAIDEVAKEPYVDADRLGCVGASFGGFSVYWLAGNHDKRFKAFIAHDGIFNIDMQYLETEEKWFVNWDLGGPYWDKQNKVAQKTYASSPHLFVDKWDTPILCIHGERDYRILANQAMSAFDAAIMRGVPAELLIYPDENHWVLKPQNGILWQRTFFEWLDKWLKK
ncbi:MAG: S9 family peptidase [Bacteroidaceae bacterium]|nr:S9 family peptidase [Bacteroidaceae bacterium]